MKRNLAAILIASASALGVNAQTLSIGAASTNTAPKIIIAPAKPVIIAPAKPVVIQASTPVSISSGTNRPSVSAGQSRAVTIIAPKASSSVSTGGARVMKPTIIAPPQPRVMAPTIVAPKISTAPVPAISTNSPTAKAMASKESTNSVKRGFLSRLFRRSEEAKAPEPLKLNPVKRRITDFQIANDLLFFNEWQQRIDEGATSAKGLKLYQLAKANAWLEFARTEYAANNRSPMIEQTFAQATNLVMRVEDGAKNMSLETPQIVECSRVRPDLWQRIAELKREMHFGRAIVEVAWLEVQLVKACHISHSKGWLAARPEFTRAESWAAIAWSRISEKPMPSPAPEFAQLPPPSLDAFPHKRQDQDTALERLEERVQAIHNLGIPVTDYRLAGAAEWLRFARATHASRNKSSVVREIGSECLRRIRAIEVGASETASAPISIGGAKAVRTDLWDAIASARDNGDNSAGALIAEAEVALVKAALQTRQFGRRSATPSIDRVEALLEQIGAANIQKVAQAKQPQKP